MKTKTKHIKINENQSYIEDTQVDIGKLCWKTLNDEFIYDLSERLNNDISKFLTFDKNKLKFIVACDSQRHKNKITYVTTIVFLRVGNGGNAYCLKEHVILNNFNNLYKLTKNERELRIKTITRERLWTECLKSVACAKWLDQNLIKYGLKVEEIHSDINFKKNHLSNELLAAITGFINSQDYKSVVKPDSWGASKIADHKTK